MMDVTKKHPKHEPKVSYDCPTCQDAGWVLVATGWGVPPSPEVCPSCENPERLANPFEGGS